MTDDFSNPDAFLDSLRADAAPTPAPDSSPRLGQVVSGSLSAGLEVRLDRDQPLEDLAVGRYVVIRAGGRIFFGMITDIALDSTNPAFEKTPPDLQNDFLRQIYLGTSTFGRIHVSPMLVLNEDEHQGEWDVKPVKTVPGHYSTVATASAEEVGYVFGKEGEGKNTEGKKTRYFRVGTPLEMESVGITIDLKKFVERSSAVFGKSGTGKTFLSRMLLAGVIKDNVASALIFDMHNEYGWEGTSEGGVKKVKGLKQFLHGQIIIATLDDESSRQRGSDPNFTVQISYEHIEPEDIAMLASVMELTETQIGAMIIMRRRLGKTWLLKFMDDDWVNNYESYDPEKERITTGWKALANDFGIPQQTLAALNRKFELFRKFDFISSNPVEDSIDKIIQFLKDKRSVVLEFGRYGDELAAYLLVANFLTRRIREQYKKLTERAFGEEQEKPHPLIIVIEEAHKFLEPEIASKTIFGTIARELRKYNVTLFIVDQRPSGIDPEVMSQVGTRVTLALDNEEDIRAVFMGVNGAQELRQVLARLDSKEQALILGHAVPMPVVVQTRRYDSDFYRQMGHREGEELQERFGQNTNEMEGRKRTRLE